MKKINIYILTLVISILTFSCVKDTINVDDISDEANREYTLDIPGGTIHATIKDALAEFEVDTLIEVDKDGLLYVNHTTEFDIEWPMVLSLDDHTGTFSYNLASLPAASSLKSTAEQVSFSDKIVMNAQDGVRLDSVYISSADMELNLDVPSEMIESITIEMPQVYIDGTSFTTTFTYPSIPQNYYVDLSGAIMRFSHDEGSDEAYIQLNTTIELIDNPSYVGSTDAAISYAITNINPEIAFGYFGNRIIDSRSVNIDFNLFSSDKLGTTIDFDDLIVDIEAYNTYGSPFQIEISDILFEDTEANTSETVELEDGADITYVNPATINNMVIDTTLTELKINKDNSSIENILQISESFVPDEVTANVEITANPEGETAINFLTNESKISASVNLNLPLYFKSSAYQRKDTIEFNYNEDFEDEDEDINLSDQVKKAKIYMDFENGLPFDVTLQVYFTDEEYEKVDSLFNTTTQETLIESGKTNATTGLVTEATESHFESEITNENLEKWKNGDVKYIIIDTHAITNDADQDVYVKITEDNYLNTTIWFSAIGSFDAE